MKADSPTWVNVFEKKGPRPTVHVLSQDLVTKGNLFTAVRNIVEPGDDASPRIVIVPANEQAADRARIVLSSVTRSGDEPGFRKGLGMALDVFGPYDELHKYRSPTPTYNAVFGRFVRALNQRAQEYTQGSEDALKAIAAEGAAVVTQEQFSGWEIPTTVLPPEEVTILWHPDSSETNTVILEPVTARNLKAAMSDIPVDHTVIIPGQYGTLVEASSSYPARLSGQITDEAISHQGLVTARLVNAREVHIWTATGTQAPDTFKETPPQETDIRVLWSPIDPLGQPKIAQEIFSDKPSTYPGVFN